MRMIDLDTIDETTLDKFMHQRFGFRHLFLTDKDVEMILEKCDIDIPLKKALVKLSGDPMWVDAVAESLVRNARDTLIQAHKPTNCITLNPGEDKEVHDTCPECGQTRYFSIHKLINGEDIICEHCGYVSHVTVTPLGGSHGQENQEKEE